MTDLGKPQPNPNAALRPTVMLVAALLTLGLFVVGGNPEASRLFPGPSHWIAHLGAYALIAAAYARALPRLATLAVAALVALIGIAHEYYEIQSHSHGFEYSDAIVNGLGALVGSLAARGEMRQRPTLGEPGD